MLLLMLDGFLLLGLELLVEGVRLKLWFLFFILRVASLLLVHGRLVIHVSTLLKECFEVAHKGKPVPFRLNFWLGEGLLDEAEILLHKFEFLLGEIGLWGYGRVVLAVAALGFAARGEAQSLGLTAGVVAVVGAETEARLLCVEGAVLELSAQKLLAAFPALVVHQSRGQLPVKLFPRHLLLPQVHHEFVYVENAVRDVAGDNAPVEVDENLRLRALHPRLLTLREQR